MVARHYGRPLPLRTIRECCSTDRQGTSLLELSRAAEHIGFRAVRVKTTFAALVSRAPLPAIVLWNQRHFVVVYARTRRGLRIADPGRGLVEYSEEEFCANWASPGTGNERKGFGLLLEPIPSTTLLAEPSRDERSPLRLLRAYVARHRRTLWQVGAGGIAVVALRLVLPFLTQAIVDVGIQQRDIGFIQLVLVAQITLIVSRTAIEFLQSWLLLHMGSRVDMTLVSDFLRRLLELPLGYFESRRHGDLLQRVEDHARVEQLLTSTALIAIGSCLSLAVFCAALLFYSTAAFVFLIAGAICQVTYASLFLRARTTLDHERFERTAGQRGLLMDCVAGIADIKLAGAEVEKRWGWERAQVDLYRTSTRVLRLEQLQHGGALLVSEVTNAVITVVAAKQVIAGGLSLGGLLAVQYLVGQVASPLSQLVGLVQPTQAARLSLERMSEVLDAPAAAPPSTHTLLAGGANGTLEVNQVVFAYRGGKGLPVLRSVDLRVQTGKVTALVGSSGSGKTTLLKLLLRLYEPDSGTIRVGSEDLRKMEDNSWRARCGAVMQDGYLFSDTIARNIALGADAIDPHRLESAARLARIDDVIAALPLGYDTRIGATGVGLSHGQRQRMLIARALYNDPEYLFLDEATSSLDAETERQIVANLDVMFRARTVLVIAHRLSTVRRADCIAVMENGSIVEHGTHDELLFRRGRYFELVHNQLALSGDDGVAGEP